MRRFTACFLLAVGGLATTASAATCVSNTFDRPFPGATEVETRHADVPSSRFPGLWQQGHIDGFVYRIWSNEDAVLQSGGAAPTWTILVTCGGSETECRQTVDGAPPAAALTVADELALCLSDPDYAGRPPGTRLRSARRRPPPRRDRAGRPPGRR